MERILVKLHDIDLMIEDHGTLVIRGTVDYEDGRCSGFPDFIPDISFIYGLLDAVGTDSLRKLDGKSLWFLYEDGKNRLGSFVSDGFLGFAPLHAKDGKVFLISEWKAWQKLRFPSITCGELRYRKIPS